MQDYLIRATAMNGKVRAFAVNSTATVEQLRQKHDTLPTATAAFGRAISAGAMMGAMLKGEEKLTIQIKGDGPIGQIVVDANAHGEVRGYVDNPQVHLPSNSFGKLDVAGAVGTTGFIHITKDLGLKAPYNGTIPIISGELGEDFTYYFAVSEQTPSSVALGVLVDTDSSVKAAGGFILQVLPGLSDAEIDQIQKQLEQMPPLTTFLDQGLTLEAILTRILGDIKVMDQLEIVFRCKCSRERVDSTLISLGRAEIEQMMDEESQAEVICHFCNEAYNYDEQQLKELMEHFSV
ncbi:MAG TPA: Hsp33 family molecular chaperone HslO [Bacilli bacterium]